MIYPLSTQWETTMEYQASNTQYESDTHFVRTFLLGMAFAFFISLSIGHASSDKQTVVTNTTDCDDSISLSKAQDRSRNGIAPGCSSIVTLQ
jgi:hypothetical protein